MTDQESTSSTDPALNATPSESLSRFTLIAAVGIMGTEEDCQKFRDLMVADFEQRCIKANEKIMQGRIVILPLEETLPTPDAQVQ